MQWLNYLISILGILVVVTPFVLKGNSMIYAEVILGVLIVIASDVLWFSEKKRQKQKQAI